MGDDRWQRGIILAERAQCESPLMVRPAKRDGEVVADLAPERCVGLQESVFDGERGLGAGKQSVATLLGSELGQAPVQ